MRPELLEEAMRLHAFGWDRISASTELIYQTNILYSKLNWSKNACCLDTVLKPWYTSDLGNLINDELNKKKSEMKTNNFKLKDSMVLYVDSLNDHITNANLTDENAIAYLKEKPKGVSNFEKVPENLEEF